MTLGIAQPAEAAPQPPKRQAKPKALGFGRAAAAACGGADRSGAGRVRRRGRRHRQRRRRALRARDGRGARLQRAGLVEPHLPRQGSPCRCTRPRPTRRPRRCPSRPRSRGTSSSTGDTISGIAAALRRSTSRACSAPTASAGRASSSPARRSRSRAPIAGDLPAPAADAAEPPPRLRPPRRRRRRRSRPRRLVRRGRGRHAHRDRRRPRRDRRSDLDAQRPRRLDASSTRPDARRPGARVPVVAVASVSMPAHRREPSQRPHHHRGRPRSSACPTAASSSRCRGGHAGVVPAQPRLRRPRLARPLPAATEPGLGHARTRSSTPCARPRAFFGGAANPNAGARAACSTSPGGSRMTVTQAAQAVQISAYPDRYAKWEAPARRLARRARLTRRARPTAASVVTKAAMWRSAACRSGMPAP